MYLTTGDIVLTILAPTQGLAEVAVIVAVVSSFFSRAASFNTSRIAATTVVTASSGIIPLGVAAETRRLPWHVFAHEAIELMLMPDQRLVL